MTQRILLIDHPVGQRDDRASSWLSERGFQIDWIESWVQSERPFLGICLGSQLLASALGAEVAPHPEGLHQIGYFPVEPTAAADGFLDRSMHVYQWHKEGFQLPEGAELLATGPDFPNQAFRFGEKIYGLQFHPEVSPAVAQRWMAEASASLEAPGAHPRSRQLADAERHDADMISWFDGFLVDWLAKA